MTPRRHARLAAILTLLFLLPVTPVAALAAQPAPNDDVADPTWITQLPFTDHLDVTHATRTDADPELTGLDCWPTPERTVWYAFTPADDVRIAADTFGSDIDTLLAVFQVTDGDLIELDCNDDAAGTVQSRVHLDLPAGTTYLVQVGTHEQQERSSLRFNVEVSTLPLLGGTTTVDPTATLTPRTGGATVSGTITCTRGATVAVDLVVIQGHTHAYGWADELACEPGATVTWTAPSFFVEGGRLRRGEAHLITRTYYRDELDYRVVPSEGPVTVSAGGQR
jgi:hypothetical protein